MPIPNFNAHGDLPEGVYSTTLAEVISRFGSGTVQREMVTARFQRIHEIALKTGAMDRLVIFGSYVSDKPEPNDVDIILVMQDDFHPQTCNADALALFDHGRASNEMGASIFWIRPGMLFGETMEDFIAHWQVRRDGGKRGIVEIKA